MKTRTCTLLAMAVCLVLASAARSDDAAKSKPLSPAVAKLVADGTPLAKGDKIAFFGDSITMQGGHIQMIAAAIRQSPATKDLGVKLLQHGLNGGRVPTVLEGKSPWGNIGGPMAKLLETEKPDVVIIALGINDVWHGAKGTTKPEFEDGLKKMVALVKAGKATLILCTPSVIGEELDAKNKMNATLDEYAEIVRKVAAEEKVSLCDAHKAFVARLKEVNSANKHSGNLTYDGVHMNEKGNALLAEAVAETLAQSLKDRSR
jgi:lysophospholipase L1-like esterase